MEKVSDNKPLAHHYAEGGAIVVLSVTLLALANERNSSTNYKFPRNSDFRFVFELCRNLLTLTATASLASSEEKHGCDRLHSNLMV